ncbi:MAG: hypothetical protein ACHREM_22145, partial [Polyangiales bacterium]
AAYHAAVEQTVALAKGIDQEVAKKAQLLRGSLGPQSGTLAKFGVKRLGGARVRKKAPKAPKPTPKA